MRILSHVNLCLMLDIYYHTYRMLVYVKCIYSRYAGTFENQTTSLRVGAELDIPRPQCAMQENLKIKQQV